MGEAKKIAISGPENFESIQNAQKLILVCLIFCKVRF